MPSARSCGMIFLVPKRALRPKGPDKINIFVSYSHRDQIWFVKDSQYDLIPWLQDALRRDDVRLWYDRSD